MWRCVFGLVVFDLFILEDEGTIHFERSGAIIPAKHHIPQDGNPRKTYTSGILY